MTIVYPSPNWLEFQLEGDSPFSYFKIRKHQWSPSSWNWIQLCSCQTTYCVSFIFRQYNHFSIWSMWRSFLLWKIHWVWCTKVTTQHFTGRIPKMRPANRFSLFFGSSYGKRHFCLLWSIHWINWNQKLKLKTKFSLITFQLCYTL